MTKTISTDAEINSIRLKEQASAPATPASGYGQLYEKNDGYLYFKNDAGLESNLIEGELVEWSNSGTITGWASYTAKIIWYKQITAKLYLFQINIDGISNNVNTSFTLPFTSKTGIVQGGAIAAIDNSIATHNSIAYLASASTSLTFYTSPAGAGWTVSGTKQVLGQLLVYID